METVWRFYCQRNCVFWASFSAFYKQLFILVECKIDSSVNTPIFYAYWVTCIGQFSFSVYCKWWWHAGMLGGSAAWSPCQAAFITTAAGEVKEPIWALQPQCRIAVPEKAASLKCRSQHATAKKLKSFLGLMLHSFLLWNSWCPPPTYTKLAQHSSIMLWLQLCYWILF